jgi:hypothetical protein
MRQDLRDRAGRLIGWRDHRIDRIEGRDHTGFLVGWYSPAQHETRDRAGRLVGSGDMLSALIVNR